MQKKPPIWYHVHCQNIQLNMLLWLAWASTYVMLRSKIPKCCSVLLKKPNHLACVFFSFCQRVWHVLWKSDGFYQWGFPRFHSILHHPSSFILHPSSIIHHPSSFILHPSSIIHHPSSFIHHPSLIVIINNQSSATMSSILKHASSSLLFAAIFSLQALKNAYPVTGPPLSLPTGLTGFYLRKHDAAGSEENAIFGEDCSLRQV